jgi:hypothetical protein
MAQTNSHEDLSRQEEVKGSSNRSFGLVFTVVFLLIALFPLLHGQALRIWALGAGGVLLLLTLFLPALLTHPNRLWLRFGLLLNAVVSPVAMGALFFLVITPIGLAMRWFGHDPLRLKFETAASSYWIKRDPPGPAPKSLSNQY